MVNDPQSQESSWTEDETVDTDGESKQVDPRSLARRLFAQYPTLQGARGAPHTSAPSSSNVTPQSIGEYTVKKHIGRGAFGDVYLCQEQHPPHRQLAIKVIRAGMDTADVLARFEAEKNALSMMNHPAIARILDAGATEDGNPYFAMEYVDGVPLTEYCAKNRLTLEERLRLFIEICQGVQHAHNKAVVHRDLKPSNIMVTEVDGVPQAKIIDFGLVKSLLQPLRDHSIHTQYGVALGTFEYMSPEQVKSGGIHLDTRSDIYALGAILYEILTGEFAFPDLRTHGYAELLRIITKVDAIRPSLRLQSTDPARASDHASTLSSEIDPLIKKLRIELDWIVMKSLEKEPERRYQTAQEFGQDISNFLVGDAVQAKPPSVIYLLKKTATRNRGILTATLLVFLSLSLGFSWALIERSKAQSAAQAEMSRSEELQEVVNFQNFQLGNFDLAKMGQQQLSDLMDASKSHAIDSGLEGEALENHIDNIETVLAPINWTDLSKKTLHVNILKPSVEVISSQFADRPLVRANLLQTLGQTFLQIGLVTEPTEILHTALQLRREHQGNDHPDTLILINNMGAMLQDQGKQDEAMPYYKEALEGSRRVLGIDHPKTLAYINNMGTLLQEQGKQDEAIPYFKEALEGFRNQLGNDHPTTLMRVNNMGYLLQDQGKLDEAMPYFREALEGFRHQLGSDDTNTHILIHNMGGLLHDQGKLDESMPYYNEALEGFRHQLGNDHPGTLGLISNMGFLLQDQAKLREAMPYYREALEGRRRVLGNDHPDTLSSIYNMGTLLQDQGKLDEAMPYYSDALESRRRVLGNDHPDTLSSIKSMGTLLQDQGKLDEAFPFYKEALEGRRRVLGDDHPQTLETIELHEELLKLQRERDEAAPSSEASDPPR